MAKNLVIVESPAKARTISRFLGKEYEVLASMGHVMDLPKSKLSIDVERDFEPDYIVSPDKTKVVKQLKVALKKSDELWIATDEDREGEAIGWHLLSALKVDEKKTPVHRIVFHEITEGAIRDSLKSPRKIDLKVVDAQQTRRTLDRLVGYELSPFLWKKVTRGLSAGRVQSVAVRLIVEREREIKAFNPEEYWSIIAEFEKEDSRSEAGLAVRFRAELKQYKGEKAIISNSKEAEKVLGDLDSADYFVQKIEEKQIKRNPAAPFITSTLQQEASRKLHFSVKKTMVVAQQLYEGIDTGSGETGLITYMRTDSVNLSKFAVEAAAKVIEADYGAKFMLDVPRVFKGKKGAQEAHEAIRPVDFNLRPKDAEKFLNKDQANLYELIWKRAIACQMKEAELNRVSVDIDAREYTFRATGQTIVFPGFMEVYMEGRDQEDFEAQDGEKILPKLEEGEQLDFQDLLSEQHFTKPPPRYTEASLVKKLEEEGIGRPSTYAPVISTIQQRGYVVKEGRQLKPEDVAFIVIDLLIKHFPEIVDVGFTAEMEQGLDDIADGEKKRVEFLRNFYKPFHELVESKTEDVQRSDALKERELGVDSGTGLPVIARFGRFGPYVQLGRIEDMEGEDDKEKKKKLKTASLLKGMTLEDVNMEQAMRLLAFPLNLGEHEGSEVTLNLGPYGPYLKWNGKNISAPKDADVLNFGIVDAVPVLKGEKERREKEKATFRELGVDPVSGGNIVLKEGRFGPYVSDGKTNASLGKKLTPGEVTPEVAIELLGKKRKKK